MVKENFQDYCFGCRDKDIRTRVESDTISVYCDKSEVCKVLEDRLNAGVHIVRGYLPDSLGFEFEPFCSGCWSQFDPILKNGGRIPSVILTCKNIARCKHVHDYINDEVK